MHGGLLPTTDEYFNVECNDISKGGISFYLKRPPGCEQFAVVLGQKPKDYDTWPPKSSKQKKWSTMISKCIWLVANSSIEFRNECLGGFSHPHNLVRIGFNP